MRLLMILCVLLSATAQATEPTVRTIAPPELTGAYLLQILFSLLVVIGGIIALTWLMRRLQHRSGSAGPSLRALASLNVGTRERVVLIEIGNKQILVGVAPGRVQTLHVLDESIDVSGKETHGADTPFAQRLKTALNSRGTP